MKHINIIITLTLTALLTLITLAETKRFAWEDTNPPGTVTNYIFRVTTTTDPTTPLVVLNTGTNQVVTVEGLEPGAYLANVQAQAGAGLFSPPSTNLLFTVRPNPTAPLNLTVSSVVNVAWTNNTSSGSIRISVP